MQTKDQGLLRPWFRSPVVVLVLACLACLLPFVNKAFHIDDPLFLWTARQIQEKPLNFYGYHLVWYNSKQPMSEVMKNPPAASYYIVGMTALFGWGEVGLHLAFLLPAVGVVCGTYFLAQRFCTRPLLAALAALLTPVFLVSSTNVMCDTMMLCFWVWAVVFWERGLGKNRLLWLCLSGVLIGLSALTKYFGMSLIPLLLAYSLVQQRALGRWLVALAIPVAVLAGYQWGTYKLYGRGLLLDAAQYAQTSRADEQQQSQEKRPAEKKLFTGLAFLGGGVVSALFFLPLLWSRTALPVWVGLAAVLMLYLPFVLLRGREDIRNDVFLQLGIFCTGGIALLALAGVDLWTHRDAPSLVLVLWVFGTWVFATFINWTINGRTILPLVPAAGILVMRRIDQRHGKATGEAWRMAWPLLPAAITSFLVTWADYRLANSARTAAAEIHEKYGDRPGTLWFQGHWGFQYYVQALGAQPLDVTKFRWENEQLVEAPWKEGDLLLMPSNNTNRVFLLMPGNPTNLVHLRVSADADLPPIKGQWLERIELAPCSWLITEHAAAGAGFYFAGPLPFVFGPVPSEKYEVVLPAGPPPKGDKP